MDSGNFNELFKEQIAYNLTKENLSWLEGIPKS